jgi:hypothetical protein
VALLAEGRESEHHFWGFPQVILSWSQSVPNSYAGKKLSSWNWLRKCHAKKIFSYLFIFLSNKTRRGQVKLKGYIWLIPGLIEGFYLNLEAAVFPDDFHRLFVCVEAENYCCIKYLSSLLQQKIMLHKVSSLLKQKIMLNKVSSSLKQKIMLHKVPRYFKFLVTISVCAY